MGSIFLPQLSQIPYVPFLILESAFSISFKSLFSFSSKTATCSWEKSDWASVPGSSIIDRSSFAKGSSFLKRLILERNNIEKIARFNFLQNPCFTQKKSD